ncbi:hypothetical protein B7463_g11139, partial [Scytalidium lignicola]
MPKVAKGRRQRAYHPKTRTGCLTCKKRRIKCDEVRPACLRCTSSGRVCDNSYYVQPPCSMRSDMVSVVAGPSFDLHVHVSPESRRSFVFFMQRTCPQQAGFFGSDFWERLVLQTAYHEPAIHYAIVAIGSLHELLERRTVIKDADKVFAFEQYSLAMRDLLLPITQTGERGVDSIQGHHALAGAHIRSGAKLLREISYHQSKGITQHQVLGSKRDRDCYVSLDAISRMYARMCPDINLINGSNKFELRERLCSDTTSDDVPLTFDSVEDAKNIFEYYRALFISSQAAPQSSSNSVDSPAVAKPDTRLFETLMSKYSLALQAYIESKSPYFTPMEDIAMAVLQLHVLGSYLSIYIELSPPDKKASWEDFMPQIKKMVQLSEKVLSTTSPGNNRGPKTFFCLDMGIVLPLYTLGSQCGDPTIRRKVIALLRLTSRQEAFWNSFLVAEAIERIMEAEENVLGGRNECTDGPDQVRLVSIEPFLGLDGNGGWLRHILRGELTLSFLVARTDPVVLFVARMDPVPLSLAALPGQSDCRPANSAQSERAPVGQIVETSSGSVAGRPAATDPEVSEYLGIPYAKPPIGDLRFAAPLKYAGFSRLNASTFGNSCPLKPSSGTAPTPAEIAASNITEVGLELITTISSPEVVYSEDCLYLNVWSRPQSGEPQKAVMVFIHGGGFTSGTSSIPIFNGAALAHREDVIVVNFNYRLSILGWPGNPTTQNNVALLDQRLAMEWIRDNISNFGGDPTRITLFGQSAGAASTDFYSYAWSSDPIAAGIILESGTTGLYPANSESVSAAAWYNISVALGCGDASTNSTTLLACMRNVEVDSLLGAIPQTGVNALLSAFGPTVDNTLIFSNYSQQTPASIPLLAGNNDYESGLFRTEFALSGETLPDSVWDAYDLAGFNCPAGIRANASLAVKNPTWRYRYFSVFPNINISAEGGAWHGAELQLLFGTTYLTGNDTAEEIDFEKYLQGAWTAFAKDPVNGLKTYESGWPLYNPAKKTLIRLGYGNAVGTNLASPILYDASCANASLSNLITSIFG